MKNNKINLSFSLPHVSVMTNDDNLQVEVKWSDMNFKTNGSSRSLLFQTHDDFLQFCAVFEKAKELFNLRS